MRKTHARRVRFQGPFKQAPSRKLTYTVFLLRLAWLAPVTLMALAYAGYSAAALVRLMRYPASSAPLEFLELLFAAGLGAAFLFFTWRMWGKTLRLLTGEIYPEPAAVFWQAGWIALAVLLPLLVILPKVKELLISSGEGANKGNLALLRIAVGEYKNARGGYPRGFEDLQAAGFLKRTPRLWDKRWAGFPHAATEAVAAYAEPGPRDSGRWAYLAAEGAPPEIFIDCTHKDSRGIPWSAY